MTVLVHGPGAYPKPPYGSFAGKPATSGDSKSFVQNFTSLSPGGYPKSLYGNFAGKNPQAALPKVGFIGGKPSKRWWEELLEEYKARYPKEPSQAKKAVAARRRVEEVVEEAIAFGLLDQFNPIVEVAAQAMTAPKLGDALEYTAKVQAAIQRLWDEDEEEAILLLLS